MLNLILSSSSHCLQPGLHKQERFLEQYWREGRCRRCWGRPWCWGCPWLSAPSPWSGTSPPWTRPKGLWGRRSPSFSCSSVANYWTSSPASSRCSPCKVLIHRSWLLESRSHRQAWQCSSGWWWPASSATGWRRPLRPWSPTTWRERRQRPTAACQAGEPWLQWEGKKFQGKSHLLFRHVADPMDTGVLRKL